jgi:NAD(P)-dependent dehydrogenase (short-subunit alcohol dehydrogenase family)
MLSIIEQYFKDKTVLVTGAGWGIGAAIALLYASHGARIIVSDSSRNGGKDTMSRIKRQKGYATYIKTDVNSSLACEKLIKRTIEIYGSIDIACNNTAIFSEHLHPEDGDNEAFDGKLEDNIHGLYNCMQYEIDAMQKQGGGIIINTSSMIGAIGLASLSSYIDAKYGMEKALQNCLGEYPARGVIINTIAPAFINTALLQEMILTKKAEGKRFFPTERPALMQEIAGLVLWLSFGGKDLFPTVLTDKN